MKKTFVDWCKNPKKEIRRFRGSKACYLLDLEGNILKEFNNLQECARHFNRKQITSVQFNNGSILNKKYRVFTIEYYLLNKVEISALKPYSDAYAKRREMYIKQNILICDLFPNEEFLRPKAIAIKLGKNDQTIRDILNGKIIKNEYNIRYKYPELQKMDFRIPQKK